MRLDPYFIHVPEDDTAAQGALEKLVAIIDTDLRAISLDQGDCVVINNHRAVHGRLPFTAHYDGNDRWLKRINVTNDLRKSRAMRASNEARCIG
jgi:alpha-ketoglutarate-dependent taurine dioxygenase